MFLALINLCQSMMSTKKHFVLQVFHQEIWNAFVSVPVVLHYKHSYRNWRTGLNQTQPALHQIPHYINLYIWLCLKVSNLLNHFGFTFLS